MRAASFVALLGAATGCERLLSIHDPVAGAGPGSDAAIDGPDGTDAGLPETSPILLSEIVVTPNDGEMIEIVNTSTQPVDLSTYYLSDSGNYFKMPVDKSVDTTDFIVKFPAGARIAGHGVVTVALDMPMNFATRYGVAPSYSLMDSSMEKIATNGTANLTNSGEVVVLFQWDGRSDRVRDVDIMLAGAPVPTNALVDKSGMSQDGPDADDAATAYATDKNTIRGQIAAPGGGMSTQRIALEAAGGEARDGNGNGPGGEDETSEDTSLTWDGTAAHPFGAPTPGTVPAALLQ